VKNDAGKVVDWFGTVTDIHELLELQERQQLLLHELQHRVRNSLAIVRSLAERTARTTNTVKEYAGELIGRINAMARTQTLLTSSADTATDIRTIIDSEIFAQFDRNRDQVSISGEAVPLLGKSAENISLAIHELASNAVKYGALSQRNGRLEVSWQVEKNGSKPVLKFVWRESGFDQPLSKPSRRGFGSDLIENVLPYQSGGKGEIDFKSDALTCTIELPFSTADAR
jgi:two-component system, chemotaxis family, CheB/CheR fusion protein